MPLKALSTFTTTIDRLVSHREDPSMKRPTKTLRRKFVVEVLESRSLMSGSTSDIFVRFTSDDPLARQQAALRSLGASVVTSYPDGPELIKLGRGVTPSSAVAKLEAESGVVYASLDSTIHVASVPILPNDPALSQDWGYNNPNNVDIDEPEALGVTVGSSSTIIAVVDTGIDLNDPDFVGKIWTNPRNDAKGGYPNDVHGWNFINNTPDVQDDDGHGTHVSAIIAATANNNYGIAGVDPAAQIMPLKFLDANGNGTTDNAVSAIYFAVNHGAQVINASWGGVQASAPLQDAIAYANSHNVVFVTAAGNDGTDNDNVPSYPSSYREPNELSVAAVDRNGNLPSFSNYGATTVDLAAPGVDIVSEVPTSIDPSGLQDLSGTSMSTAYVSGVAALVSGLNPSFTAAQIVQRLDSTTKALPSLAGKTISGGMVDAYNAVVGNSVPVAAGAMNPTLSSQADVHASILASDEYFAAHGGTEDGFLTGLYENVLGRDPDPAGLQYWEGVYNSGTETRLQIAQSFVTSLEGRLTEVAQWYQQDLGRTASLDELKADPGVLSWAEQLVQGAGDDTIQAEILSSPEFLADNGSASVPFVQAIYQDLTDRAADDTGLSYWEGQLSQGVTPYQMIRSFQTASEVADTLIATWYSEDLDRPGPIAQLKDDSGIQGWAGDLSSS
jgi:thermitase